MAQYKLLSTWIHSHFKILSHIPWETDECAILGLNITLSNLQDSKGLMICKRLRSPVRFRSRACRRPCLWTENTSLVECIWLNFVSIKLNQTYLGWHAFWYHSTHAFMLSGVWAPSRKYLICPQSETKTWFRPGHWHFSSPVAVLLVIEKGEAPFIPEVGMTLLWTMGRKRELQ